MCDCSRCTTDAQAVPPPQAVPQESTAWVLTAHLAALCEALHPRIDSLCTAQRKAEQQSGRWDESLARIAAAEEVGAELEAALEATRLQMRGRGRADEHTGSSPPGGEAQDHPSRRDDSLLQARPPFSQSRSRTVALLTFHSLSFTPAPFKSQRAR